MLSDRSYMRDDYEKGRTSVLIWLLCALIAGFFLQVIFDRAVPAASGSFQSFLQLSIGNLGQGYVWTFLTYPLMHQNVVHLACNALSIYFLGREVLPYTGEKRFLGLVVSATLLGGLAWYGVNHSHPDTVIGASSISMSLLILFACLNPDREISFLFFFIPVTLKPKYLAWISAGIDTVGMITSELNPGSQFNTGIAHSAHLGGMAAALAYFWLVHQREWKTPDGRAEIELPKWLKKKKDATPEAEAPKYKVNLSNRSDLKAEVDRILDKINSQGFGALTAEEKKVLDDAKDSLSRR